MKKVTFSKLIEKKFVRDCLTNERELNYPLGYRGVVITVKNSDDGKGLLLSLERYLNEYDLIDFTEYDASLSTWDNKAEITFVVNEDHLDVFFEVYDEFKINHKSIIERFIKENEDCQDDTEIKLTPVIRVNTHKEYEAAKRELKAEFDKVIINNHDYQREILEVSKKYNEMISDIHNVLFLAHINQLSPEWVQCWIHHKEKWDYSDLIIKWARMAETGKYMLSKMLIFEY
ncbi:MAG: hypothetical protein EHM20_00175 [Alphaproteobacteria bacterium]|nr:MAG: hypothetical protein EHM20_00175 [Alphaproteobacteria bacterium]